MPLSWNEIKSRATVFSRNWADAGNEDSQAKPFLIDFFEIFGITDKRVASFEHAVEKHGGGRGYVDLFWPGILLVEMKSRGKSLDRAFDQAMDYFPGIAERDLPRYVLVCDFARFRLYDLTTGQSSEIALKELYRHARPFGFIAGYQTQVIKPQDPINIKAAERMGKLHDQLKAVGYVGRPLEVYLVRLLFCLFAEDTSIFQKRQFQDYIENRTAADGSDLGYHLDTLFYVLNTPADRRQKNLDEDFATFEYINGKLFEERLPPASFDSRMRETLLDLCALDWSAISPAIFGSLFQSIMDDKARRNLGAHYTSEVNILKLIKPLFLDTLWAEFDKVKGNRNRLFEFHKKLRSLRFFDPACGCGNFLVITYRELRLLELEVLRTIYQTGSSSQFIGAETAVMLDVDQFHGIEIEEFPAQIAQVALWLTDHQMNMRVSEEFGAYFARIPLKATPHIVCGNALRLDWGGVLPPERCSYVLGNPPFVGKKEQNASQKADLEPLFAKIAGSGVLDYVTAWYLKATRYIAANPIIRCAFVSTNSITQGEQVGVLWSWLLAHGVHIHFAHRTFSWSNEARGKAAVHCVIIGFGLQDMADKTIFEYEDVKGEAHSIKVGNINPYLIDAPNILLDNRNRPISQVDEIVYGSFALDDGNYTLSEEAASLLMQAEPESRKYIRPFIGGLELIRGERRYCLWLLDAAPDELKKCPQILEKVRAVQVWRQKSERKTTQELAATPSLFAEIRQPVSNYLALPTVSSERRLFLPIAYLDREIIASNQLYVIPNAKLFHFGILTSTMHNAWVRSVCGRLESRYRYSASIVYNNFPWPAPDDQQCAAIETAAQGVLDTRAAHPGATLADLYDPLTMPPDLFKAHQALDKAVDAAYGYKGATARQKDLSPGYLVDAAYGYKGATADAARVAFLFERYQQITSLLPVEKPARKRKPRPR